ncbi:MAG: hypothetical protein HY273_01435 [Gammaproteobacteria bacterium]|nr:hypothetical protein [Gammaproteobacteria bacterium]
MGMNNKLKAIVALAVLGAASQAHAAVLGGASGNGELYLSVWDDTAKVSYTKDLGMTMDAFIASGNTLGYSTSYSFGSDANWTSFLSQVGGVSNANLQWTINAADTTGTGTSLRFLTTSNAGVAALQATTNSAMSTGFKGNINTFIDAVNLTGTHATQADGSSVNAAADAVNAYEGTLMGNTFGGKTTGGWSTSAYGLSSSLEFFSLSPSSTSSGGKAVVNQFGDLASSTMGKWTIDPTGTATYTVSAVPVPAALWLLGSAMVGLVGVARRKVA